MQNVTLGQFGCRSGVLWGRVCRPIMTAWTCSHKASRPFFVSQTTAQTIAQTRLTDCKGLQVLYVSVCTIVKDASGRAVLCKSIITPAQHPGLLLCL